MHDDIDRLIKLRRLVLAQRLDRVSRCLNGSDERTLVRSHTLAMTDDFCFFRCHGDYASTVTPIERAVPAMTRIAASILPAFRSFIFSSAIFFNCA